jgi:hypothetical protein
VYLASSHGLYVGAIEVAYFCGDENQRLVGELSQSVDFKLKEEAYQQFRRDGASFTGRVPVTAAPKYVRVVAYDAGSDRLGSAFVELKNKE